jgi:hypothetical protein
MAGIGPLASSPEPRTPLTNLRFVAEKVYKPLLRFTRWLMPLFLPRMQRLSVHFQVLRAFFDGQFQFQASGSDAISEGAG